MDQIAGKKDVYFSFSKLVNVFDHEEDWTKEQKDSCDGFRWDRPNL